MPKKKQAVSPVNGQPVPRGRQFTSETAREARQRRTEKERAQKSITEAFKSLMTQVFVDEKTGAQKTGAEIIAQSIVSGAMHGNGKMVELALAMMGETPAIKVDGRLSADIEDLTPLIEMLKQ